MVAVKFATSTIKAMAITVIPFGLHDSGGNSYIRKDIIQLR